MIYIQYAFEVSIALIMFIVISKICMQIARYIGEKLGVARFLMYLWRKIRKKKLV